jgi:hypothetical protein
MTTSESNLDWLDRVRKLLDTAESFAEKSKEPGDDNDKTAQSYQSRAFELAARFEIDRALLLGKTPIEAIKVLNQVFDLGRPYAQQITLAYIIYTSFGCQLVDISYGRSKSRKSGMPAHPGRVHAFGFKGDMQQASMLLTSLTVQAQLESVRRYRQYLDNFEPWSCPECDETKWEEIPWDKGYYRCVECHVEIVGERPAEKPDRRSVWYRSFWNGWVSALRPRIEKAHRKVQDVAESSGTGAVVALRNRDLVVKEAFDERYPKTVSRSTRGSKGSGYSAGREAGRNADIGGKKIGATRRELS